MLEKELHSLLKQNPWLIRTEFSNYLTSDEDVNKVVSKLAKELGVDQFAPIKDGDKVDETRPDLVFLMSDPVMAGPFILNVVELKSPSTPLTIDHHDQLDEYMFKIKAWCEAELSNQVALHGFLIGAMPDGSTRAVPQQRLIGKFKDSKPSDPIRIVGMRQLIKEAWNTAQPPCYLE